MINSFVGKQKRQNCKNLIINGDTISNPQDIANQFNDHFSTVAEKLVNSLPKTDADYSDFLRTAHPASIYIWPTCPAEISNILRDTKSKLSAGIDQIPSKVLKSSPDTILVAHSVTSLIFL